MRKTIAYPYLALGLFLFCWINIPKNTADWLRSISVAPFDSAASSQAHDELTRLQLENQNLRTQLESVYEWLSSDQRIGEQIELLKGLSQAQIKAPDEGAKSFFQRRIAQLKSHLTNLLTSLPARVIYRDPSSWSSSLWVNVGENDNTTLGRPIIAKNSPVMSGNALIGVIDFVGKNQSRVRLITDSGLSPSVRTIRGSPLNEDGYLAKGEVHGSSVPFWRSRSPILKGIGFNYDYPDEEGPSRDLKTGHVVGTSKGAAVPILKEGDLLVTSGLDGVFPPGLKVGVVSWVNSLKEGSYAYEIEAHPAAGNLNDLQTLFILPALSSE